MDVLIIAILLWILLGIVWEDYKMDVLIIAILLWILLGIVFVFGC